MKSNREKALREYYNKFTMDDGEKQVFKRGAITRNATLHLPVLYNETNKQKFVFGFDPARSFDSSICTVMRVNYDENIGYFGEIVSCVSFAELASKKRTPMKTPDQIKYFKQMLLDYNGKAPDYENIMAVLFDSGAGGGGKSAFADNLLAEWTDSQGRTHKGLIDPNDDDYKAYVDSYPNAVPILRLIEPKKHKRQMVEELKELLDLDLIKFTAEYSGKGFVAVPNDTKDKREIIEKTLAMEEEISLINIDILKTETVSIHRNKSTNGNVSYEIPKDKENKVGDDRFYTLLLLAHYLYELRRGDNINREAPTEDISKYMFFN